MKLYLLSLGAGILVGIIYSLIHVRSPAPPLIALVGLLGMLVGEQAIPSARQLLGYSAPPVLSRQASGTGRLSSTRSGHAVVQADRGLAGNEEEHS
ncbi:XapX domain-containing protein [Burkholderia sp. OK233]|nr:XapX domain-containing protein [Burkholderia sp. OK233]